MSNNVKNFKKVDDMLKEAKKDKNKVIEQINILMPITEDVKKRLKEVDSLLKYLNQSQKDNNIKNEFLKKSIIVKNLADEILTIFNNDDTTKILGHADDGVNRIKRVIENLKLKLSQPRTNNARRKQVEGAEQGLQGVKSALSRVEDMIRIAIPKSNDFDKKSLELASLVGIILATDKNYKYVPTGLRYDMRSTFDNAHIEEIRKQEPYIKAKKLEEDKAKQKLALRKKEMAEWVIMRAKFKEGLKRLWEKETGKLANGKNKNEFEEWYLEEYGDDDPEAFDYDPYAQLVGLPGGGALPKRKRKTRRRNK